MNIPRDKALNQRQPTGTWVIVLGRFGRLLFSLAIIAIGIATLICSYLSSRSAGPHYKIVPVIPWLPSIPSLAYLVGAILLLCGTGLLVQRTLLVSCVILGAVMLLCGLAFDAPRRPNLMSAEWRTNVLEPIAIASLAWLVPGLVAIPRWLYRTSRYLLAFVFIVFGIAHFQVLPFIARLVPGWIPWHWFWAVFFGVAFVAAGVSFATGFLQGWASLGVGLMFALWAVTIHIPALFTAPQDPDKWSDVFIVAALCGGSWALARTLLDRGHLGLEAGSNRALTK